MRREQCGVVLCNLITPETKYRGSSVQLTKAEKKEVTASEMRDQLVPNSAAAAHKACTTGKGVEWEVGIERGGESSERQTRIPPKQAAFVHREQKTGPR